MISTDEKNKIKKNKVNLSNIFTILYSPFFFFFNCMTNSEDEG